MRIDGYRCDGCAKEVGGTPAEWIAVERRGDLISISTTLYTASSYKHYCPECAEKGIQS